MEINLDAISKLTQIDATEAVKNTGMMISNLLWSATFRRVSFRRN